MQMPIEFPKLIVREGHKCVGRGGGKHTSIYETVPRMSVLMESVTQQKSCLIGCKSQFADRQTSFEPNLPTNSTFFEFCQQYKIYELYWYSEIVPTR